MTGKPLRRVLVSGLCAVALSGCSGAPDDGDELAASSTSERSIAGSSSPSPSSPAEARDLPWTTLESWTDGESPEVASRRYVVLKSRDGRSVVVRNADATRVVHTYRAPDGMEVNEVFLRSPILAVVTADPQEERGEQLAVIDLRSSAERGLAAGAPKPWVGSWSMGEDALTYGVRGPGRTYCMAEVRLGNLDGDVVECAPPHHGTNQVEQSPYGFAFTRFDDTRPAACGTARVRRGSAEPVEMDGPASCSVWETVPLEGTGAIWAEVPDKEKIEVAEIFVRTGDGEPESLGYGTTGSLTWCGESVWFLRQQESTVMRWSPDDGLEQVFGPAREAVLSTPVCTGDSVSILEARDAPGAGNKTLLHRTPALG